MCCDSVCLRLHVFLHSALDEQCSGTMKILRNEVAVCLSLDGLNGSVSACFVCSCYWFVCVMIGVSLSEVSRAFWSQWQIGFGLLRFGIWIIPFYVWFSYWNKIRFFSRLFCLSIWCSWECRVFNGKKIMEELFRIYLSRVSVESDSLFVAVLRIFVCLSWNSRNWQETQYFHIKLWFATIYLISNTLLAFFSSKSHRSSGGRVERMHQTQYIRLK